MGNVVDPSITFTLLIICLIIYLIPMLVNKICEKYNINFYTIIIGIIAILSPIIMLLIILLEPKLNHKHAENNVNLNDQIQKLKLDISTITQKYIKQQIYYEELKAKLNACETQLAEKNLTSAN